MGECSVYMGACHQISEPLIRSVPCDMHCAPFIIVTSFAPGLFSWNVMFVLLCEDDMSQIILCSPHVNVVVTQGFRARYLQTTSAVLM